MKLPSWLPSLALFIGIMALTVNFWITYYKSTEKFANVDIATALDSISAEAKKETPPTDAEAALAYRSLLVYTKTNFSKGLLFVYDLNKRIYGKSERVPDSFDPRKLMDGYSNPLTGL
jgi:hypothetical protein